MKFTSEEAQKCNNWCEKKKKSYSYQIMELEGTKGII